MHSSNNYLLSTYYVPAIVLGTCATSMSKAMVLDFIAPAFSQQRQDIHNTHMDKLSGTLEGVMSDGKKPPQK